MHVPFFIGVWLSLVERYVRDVEVAGSNPVTPIFYCQKSMKLKTVTAKHMQPPFFYFKRYVPLNRHH